MSQTLRIKNGRVIDPANKIDEVRDLYCVEGRIVASTKEEQMTAPKSLMLPVSSLHLDWWTSMFTFANQARPIRKIFELELKQPLLEASLHASACQIPHRSAIMLERFS